MSTRGSLSLVEQHVEKGAVGLAAAFLIGLCVYYFIMEPNKIEYGGQQLGPRELDQTILREAEQLRDAIKRAQAKPWEVANYADQLDRQFKTSLFQAESPDVPGLKQQLAIAGVFGLPLPEARGSTEVPDIELVTPLPPRDPLVATGISLAYPRRVTASEEGQPDVAEGEEPIELSWITVGAFFPRKAQEEAMLAAQYAKYRAGAFVVGVDLQRQELTFAGDYSDWSDVTPGEIMPQADLSAPIFDDRTGRVLNAEDLDAELETVKSSQADYMQPAFYRVEAGDTWGPPVLGAIVDKGGDDVEIPAVDEPGEGDDVDRKEQRREVRDNLKNAQKALRERDWSTAKEDAGKVLRSPHANRGQLDQAESVFRTAHREITSQQNREAGAGEFVVDPETDDPAIWFHDQTVTPGKTYRYRLRVRLWNRYVGRRDAVSAASQDRVIRTALVGAWSAPTEPVTAAPKRHFFVTGHPFGSSVARVEVFTWHLGNWLKESFDVEVGQLIGDVQEVKTGKLDSRGRAIREPVDFSTGAVVLDMRFDEPVLLRKPSGREGEFTYRESESLVMVYVDPADGQTKESIIEADRADPLYKRLKSEWDSFKSGL